MLRDSAHRLLERFDQMHAHPSAVEERIWADYVAGLDRALDALTVEMNRAAEHPQAEQGVEQTLLVHMSVLELAGWRMRFTLSDAAPVVHFPPSEPPGTN